MPEPIKCQQCSSENIGYVCFSYCAFEMYNQELSGDNICPGFESTNGAKDDFELEICYNCGQVQGEFPKVIKNEL